MMTRANMDLAFMKMSACVGDKGRWLAQDGAGKALRVRSIRVGIYERGPNLSSSGPRFIFKAAYS